jgi:hypothetical protein
MRASSATEERVTQTNENRSVRTGQGELANRRRRSIFLSNSIAAQTEPSVLRTKAGPPPCVLLILLLIPTDLRVLYPHWNLAVGEK